MPASVDIFQKLLDIKDLNGGGRVPVVGMTEDKPLTSGGGGQQEEQVDRPPMDTLAVPTGDEGVEESGEESDDGNE